MTDGTATGPAPAAATTPARPRPKILIAEDEAIIRLDLKEMLEEEGFEVVGEASDGEAAIRLATERAPDLVIMDIKMPGMDGLTAAERIVEADVAAVLILTAFSQRDLVQRAAEAGAMGYLVKPFQKSDLMPALDIALARYQELRVVRRESASLADQLETRKLVDRAKGKLMDSRGLSEAEAFRHIQKRAMDERSPMREVAASILED
ncbi:MAG: response regulator [Actinobacteria bacterium]|nr:response regulator [Actinomycetota bacterium]